MTKFTLDMDPGAYLIGWAEGGFSPALVWMTESGERMICCSNWINPTKVANVVGLPLLSLKLLGEWVPAGEVPEGDGFELNEAIDAIAQGVAKLLVGQQELAAAGLRGADRGVAILKHLQEIGDNVRGVSGAIGDKFGVVLDAVKDVGEKVEACMTIASNTEEGLSVSIEKLDKLGVEKWREAIKHVEAEGITEPMHDRVKASGYYDPGNLKPLAADESGLGKLWADVTVNLEDVSDETLDDLHRSEQIGTARYVEERGRRIAEKIDLGEGIAKHVGVDPAHGADAMAFTFMRDGKTLGTMKEFPVGEPFELADLRNQLRTAKMLEAFWRKAAATRGARIQALADQVMDMGEMVDALTGRTTGA